MIATFAAETARAASNGADFPILSSLVVLPLLGALLGWLEGRAKLR